ncbi:putative ferric-chelate reductase 1 isoform X2 [Hoplias malabaricus]|uniref:putative ferric-chelate reductase 1 isoform X2 n=1 Tax=Hoplias malabaricus TaxID=27720 RepID=UPI0034629DF9
MYRVLLIFLGGATLQFVKCFSDGDFDAFPEICQTMAVDHSDSLPQTSVNPYTVSPDNVSVSDVGNTITVTLSGTRSFRGFMLEARETDRGPPVGVFSLIDSTLSRLQMCNGNDGKAVTQNTNRDKNIVRAIWTAPNPGLYFFRESIPMIPATTPTVTVSSASSTVSSTSTTTTVTAGPEVTSLVSTSTVVPTSVGAATQSNESKTATSTHTFISYSNPQSGQFQTTITEITTLLHTIITHTKHLNGSTQDVTSTATVVSSSPASVPSSNPQTRTTVTEVTTLLLTSTSDPSLLATTTATTTKNTCLNGSEWFLVLLLLSCLCIDGCFSILVKHRKQRCVALLKASSIISEMFSIVAFVILLVFTKLVAASVLTGLALIMGSGQIIVIFLFRGPSCELRKYLCLAFGLITFANMCLTMAAIFVGLVVCKTCSWLLVVMAVYVAFVLFYILYLYFTSKNFGKIHQRSGGMTLGTRQEHTTNKAPVHHRTLTEISSPDFYWYMRILISTLMNTAFTAVLITGIFLCKNAAVTNQQK